MLKLRRARLRALSLADIFFVWRFSPMLNIFRFSDPPSAATMSSPLSRLLLYFAATCSRPPCRRRLPLHTAIVAVLLFVAVLQQFDLPRAFAEIEIYAYSCAHGVLMARLPSAAAAVTRLLPHDAPGMARATVSQLTRALPLLLPHHAHACCAAMMPLRDAAMPCCRRVCVTLMRARCRYSDARCACDAMPLSRITLPKRRARCVSRPPRALLRRTFSDMSLCLCRRRSPPPPRYLAPPHCRRLLPTH